LWFVLLGLEGGKNFCATCLQKVVHEKNQNDNVVLSPGQMYGSLHLRRPFRMLSDAIP
jgi:hypothetical protein